MYVAIVLFAAFALFYHLDDRLLWGDEAETALLAVNITKFGVPTVTDGKNVVTLCMGTACHVRGARLLLDQATGQLGVKPGEVTPDGLFSIEYVNCLGACALGPIVTENGSYHHHMTPGKLRKLIETLSRQKTEDNQDAKAQ